MQIPLTGLMNQSLIKFLLHAPIAEPKELISIYISNHVVVD